MLQTYVNLFQIPLKLWLNYTTLSPVTDGIFNLIPILSCLGLSGLYYELPHSEGNLERELEEDL